MLSLFKSYFKLALRHSWKNKWSVLINVTGLGLALSMCIFLYLIFAFNMEFDSFHKDTENTYRLHAMTSENGAERRNEIAPFALESKLRNDISGIDAVSSYSGRSLDVKIGNEFFTEYVGIASTDFFEMFEIPLWYGSMEGFGEQPLVYLDEASAKKYFGNEVALGKTMTLYFINNNKIDFTVGGVFQKIPINSSFEFDILINQKEYMQGMDIDPNDWTNKRYEGLYIKTSLTRLEQITEEINGYVPLQNEGHEERKISRFELVPFLSPLVSNETLYRSFVTSRLRPSVYIIFSVLIVMIFLTACFNLANTSMAMIAKRLKEIGIRKTLGSGSRQILVQFLFEMGIVSALAFIVALLTANTTSDAILGLFSASFLLQDANLTGVILFVLGFLIITTVIAGLLPALYAWKFQPVSIMRKAVKLRGVNWLNRSLTVAQYSFSIAVLAAGITFSQNSDFLKEMHLGYDDDNMIDLYLGKSEFHEVIRQEVEQIPGVQTASTFNHVGGFGRYSTTKLFELDTLTEEVRHYAIGFGYLELMDISIVGGRSFIDGSEADQKESVLVSQSFAERYFSDNEPIGQLIKIGGDRKQIVGVVAEIIDDVYEDSELRPSVYSLTDDKNLRHLVVKVNSGDLEDVDAKLRAIWSKHLDKPYDGQLQEELALGEAGRDTRNLQKIFIAMAILGGFLSIVGIFSLAKLNVAKRIKEISVRKVLGASLKELLYTINRSFVIVLSIAMIVGCGLGYFISDAVLGLIYKYYIDVSAITISISGVFIVVISLLIITGAIVAPANANPVTGLREE